MTRVRAIPPVPKRSAAAWAAHRGKSPQNPGLVFDHFVPVWGQSGSAEAKQEAWREICGATGKADRNLLRAWSQRWEALVRATGAETFTARTDWRLVIGLGRKGPLEVGFTFHRYGLPYIPGSSVKGIARAYARQIDGRTERDPEFRAVFGAAPGPVKSGEEGAAGNAVFFDAIPADAPSRMLKLEVDVMNPHYPDYYSGRGATAPGDWQSPVPITFLAVAAGTPFRFAVGWRAPLNDTSTQLRDLAIRWLRAGLRDLGVGAKTGAGYGYFEVPK